MMLGTDAVANALALLAGTAAIFAAACVIDARLARSRRWQRLVARATDGRFVVLSEREWLREFAQQNAWEMLILWIGIALGWLFL